MNWNTKILYRLEGEVEYKTLIAIDSAFKLCKWYKGIEAMKTFLKDKQDIWNALNTPFKGLNNRTLVDVLYIYPLEAEEAEKEALKPYFHTFEKNEVMDYTWKIDFIAYSDFNIVFCQVKHSFGKFRYFEDVNNEYLEFCGRLDYLKGKIDFKGRKIFYRSVSYLGDPADKNKKVYQWEVA